MYMNLKRIGLILSLLVLPVFQISFSQVKLPRLISDGMVLQRDAQVKIWGWASAGEKITIHFRDEMYKITADKEGQWTLMLSQLKAGGPYDMDIRASNRITLKDILIGDVWICSGQSNMVLPMSRVRDLYKEEIAQSENPNIRQFLVPMRYDFNTPQEYLQSGSWEPANPENVLHFTAAGYFFAKTLFGKYGIPIGLINASVGGSPAEAWMSEEVLKAFPAHLETAIQCRYSSYVNQIIAEDKARSDAWHELLQNRQRT